MATTRHTRKLQSTLRELRSKHGITPTASTTIGLVIELRLENTEACVGRVPNSQHLYRFAKKTSQP